MRIFEKKNGILSQIFNKSQVKEIVSGRDFSKEIFLNILTHERRNLTDRLNMKEHRVMAIEKEQFDTNRELKNFKSVQMMQQSCHRV